MNNTKKLQKMRNIITVFVILLSAICCIVPIITNKELTQTTMISTFGEEINLYGKGVYGHNSFSMAIQAISQDIVTLILILPCMIASLCFVRKGKAIAEYILTGLIGYMLYTYMSYSFLMFYNILFLFYVVLMALSFYGFILSIQILSQHYSVEKLQENLKTKGIRIFLNITGIFIAMMWLGRIFPTIVSDTLPVGLDNYSTLVIQALDLGVIVPACFVISHLLKIKNRLGFILGPVIIIKGVALVIAVLTMAFCMMAFGIEVAPVEYVVFGIICVLAIYYMVRILKQIGKISK